MFRRSVGFSLLVLALAGQGVAADDAAEVRAVVGAWYDELRKGRDARPWTLTAPSAMILPRRCPDRCGPQKRSLDLAELQRPRFLAEHAEKFAYEVERLSVERTLARADVWERGWRYAWAVEKTTESAAAGLFILEKRAGEGWKILVYRSESRALRPKDKDGPMPDLRPEATPAVP
jgi:hypothetical protein